MSSIQWGETVAIYDLLFKQSLARFCDMNSIDRNRYIYAMCICSIICLPAPINSYDRGSIHSFIHSCVL